MSVEAASDFAGGLVAAEGDQFLYLTTGPGNRSEPTGNDTTGNGTNEFDESFLILSISRGQNDPGRLRFAVDVMTSEGIQPDTAEVARVVTASGVRVGEEPKIQQSMNEPNGPDFVPITAFSGSSIGGPDGSSFSRGNTGHMIYELDVDYPGIGLVFRVRDEGDGIFDTAITIDDIRYVPEPAVNVAVLFSMLACVGLAKRRGSSAAPQKGPDSAVGA